MAMVHGKNGYIKIATNDLSAWVDSVTFSHSAQLAETTTYGKSYVTRIGGLKDATWTVSGLFDSAAGSPETVLVPLIGGAATAIEWGPEGNTAPDVKYTGTVIVESYEESVPVGDVVRFTATLQNTDTITKGVYA